MGPFLKCGLMVRTVEMDIMEVPMRQGRLTAQPIMTGPEHWIWSMAKTKKAVSL
jgi:hypothetical protein